MYDVRARFFLSKILEVRAEDAIVRVKNLVINHPFLYPTTMSNSFRITLWIVLILAVIGFAILFFQESLFSPPKESSNIPDTLSKVVTLEWKRYENTKYGFMFKYPPNRTAYEGIDYEKQRLIPAGPESTSVAVAHREGGYIFSGVSSAVSIHVISERVDARTWFDRHTQEYTKQGRVEAITSIQFGGKKALEIRGEAGSDNHYRLIIVQFPEYLVVIHQNTKSTLLDDVVRTFMFTK